MPRRCGEDRSNWTIHLTRTPSCPLPSKKWAIAACCEPRTPSPASRRGRPRSTAMFRTCRSGDCPPPTTSFSPASPVPVQIPPSLPYLALTGIIFSFVLLRTPALARSFFTDHPMLFPTTTWGDVLQASEFTLSCCILSNVAAVLPNQGEPNYPTAGLPSTAWVFMELSSQLACPVEEASCFHFRAFVSCPFCLLRKIGKKKTTGSSAFFPPGYFPRPRGQTKGASRPSRATELAIYTS